MNTSISLINTPSISNYLPYKVIKSNEKETWNHYVKKAYVSDFYHTLDYHFLDKQGDPLLFVYEWEDFFIAFPLIKRSIEGSDYFDCTSVYGYTGPIANIDFAKIPLNICHEFEVAFESFFRSEKIVSVFCVLHPFSNQCLLLRQAASIVRVGNTIAVDLRQSLEEQRMQYRRPIRMKINQLRRKGFEVKLANSDEQLLNFAKIYRENMIKVGAPGKYLFEDSYFENFMRATDYTPELLLAYHQDQPVAGAMVALTNNIMQLHLAGTRIDYFVESPMKLIFDEACLLGRTREMHFMHLGSGVGGKEDSLFHFKRGFSECLFEFNSWRYVVDEKIYNELVQEKLAGKVMPDTSSFPLYRFI